MTTDVDIRYIGKVSLLGSKYCLDIISNINTNMKRALWNAKQAAPGPIATAMVAWQLTLLANVQQKHTASIAYPMTTSN